VEKLGKSNAMSGKGTHRGGKKDSPCMVSGEGFTTWGNTQKREAHSPWESGALSAKKTHLFIEEGVQSGGGEVVHSLRREGEDSLTFFPRRGWHSRNSWRHRSTRGKGGGELLILGEGEEKFVFIGKGKKARHFFRAISKGGAPSFSPKREKKADEPHYGQATKEGGKTCRNANRKGEKRIASIKGGNGSPWGEGEVP